ncbi:hypothetical protein CHH61_04240 [Shouchella clausii]|uniref:Uncharacterized protein n=1 Tax=Shouchella clausii TaxID=79880 RepID=A0A268S3Y9_SHOCL|nr:hypothetical protein CHH61_04240 [Shouchella clausii]
MYSAPVNAPNRADSSGSWAAFRAGVRTRSCQKKAVRGVAKKVVETRRAIGAAVKKRENKRETFVKQRGLTEAVV